MRMLGAPSIKLDRADAFGETTAMHRGSCLCQSVQYEIAGELGAFGYCHCTSCRKASGSAHAANAPVDRTRFRLVAGAEALREFESSPGKRRAFCSRCGSPIYAYLERSADVIRTRLGTLDTHFDRRPRAHTFVADKASWAPIDDELPQFPAWAPTSVLDQRGSRQPTSSERDAAADGYVFAQTETRSELERLRALESVFDPATRRTLLTCGLAAGWRCLEVGAGAGSIARWMRDQVGPTGRVVALDMDTRFLVGPEAAGLDVVEGDVRKAALEPASFDLVHARFVLIHLADWPRALDVVMAVLKPGGWLVLEEPDFSSARTFAGPEDLRRSFESVHRAIEAMFAARGMDHAFGTRIPRIVQERRLAATSIDHAAPIVPGGSPFARMMSMSTEQLARRYVETGLARPQDIEQYAAFTADPQCWATYHGTIRGVGRKPAEG